MILTHSTHSGIGQSGKRSSAGLPGANSLHPLHDEIDGGRPSALSHLRHGEPGGGALLLPLRDAAPRRRVHAHRFVRRAVLGGREPVRADLHDHAAQQPRDRRQLPLGDDHQRGPDRRGHRARPAADRGRRGGVPDPGRLPRLHLRREHVGGRTGPGRGRSVPRHRTPGRADLAVLLPLGLRRPVQLASPPARGWASTRCRSRRC